MDTLPFIIVAGTIFLYALIARILDRTILTAPMLFTAIGLLLGPAGLHLIDLSVDEPAIHLLIEGTLVLVLFTDASKIQFDRLRKGTSLPVRLLILGLPMTILLGVIGARLVFPEMSWVELALLAIMLAPTDAALGQAVVTSERVSPVIRQALNVESGLNDGIAVPFFIGVFLTAGLATNHNATASHDHHTSLAAFTAAQLLLGPFAGVLVAWPAGWLAERSATVRTSTPGSLQIAGLVIAFAAFSVASLIGGNGLIAAFVAGLVIGNTTRQTCDALIEFAEDEGQLLVLLAFLIFGASMMPVALRSATPRVILYAILSLTVIRILPVILSMKGSGLHTPSVFFLGWFGPRGLATVLFALLINDAQSLQGRQEVFAIACIVVATSIILHGTSAAPLAALYGRWHERLRSMNPQACECLPVPGDPTNLKKTSAARLTDQEAT